MATTLPVLPNGIQRIALSFSGGGFRAASFSLGCAAYLHHVPYAGSPLFDKVRFISSASGGSITNLMLCHGFRQGHRFEAIFQEQAARMSGCNLMDKVFTILNEDSAWQGRPEKSRNLINAFAMAYDQYFFRGASFSSLTTPAPGPGYTVAETCVNTTEFDNGMNFRFGTGGVIGNKYLHFRTDAASLKTAGNVRLGDILACSSCFPAGFESLMFPHDLTHPTLSAADLNQAIFESDNYNGKETSASARNQEISFGFMDGGIDDNQGIYAFLLADERTAGHYDLYFTCDVTSNFLQQPFQYPKASSSPLLQQNLPRLEKTVKSYTRRYITWCVIAFLAGIALCIFSFTRPYGLVLSGISFSALALPLIAYLVLKGQIKALIAEFLPPAKPGAAPNSWLLIFNRYKDRLLQLPLNRLVAMLIARASSVLLLASVVYLKKIRRISYDYLFSEKAGSVYQGLIEQANAGTAATPLDAGALWKDHTGVTTIYLLASRNDFMLQQILNNSSLKGQPVSDTDTRLLTSVLYPLYPKLRAAADTATNMDTTLWFDENQVKDQAMEAIIATG